MTSASTQPSFDAIARAARLAAIGDAFPALAHDVNNALLAILGLAELTLRDVAPGTKPHDRLTLLHSTARELTQNVRVLHAFARRPEEDGPVELGAVLQETLAVAERTTASRTIEFTASVGDGGHRVEVGARLLGQVVLALLAEARRMLTAGGTVTASLVRDGDRAVLAVAASGPELDLAAPGRDELGLWVAAQVAARNGGALSADGGTLTLTLPAAGAA